MIIINFKTYPEATGKKAVALAQLLEKEARKHKIKIILCPQMVDLNAVAHAVRLPVFAQHVDALSPGNHTGWITAESLAAAGASGVLINHSEHRLSSSHSSALAVKRIAQTVLRARSQKLITVVCVKNLVEARAVLRTKPTYIALESPELIGGKISVSTAHPQLIQHVARAIGKKLLVGAGVHTAEDVRVALQHGASGVLVSSGIVRTQNPAKVLGALARGFDN